ncbi:MULTISPECIES: hypothetical protein [unclassified Anaeromyxobacter]|uniref:hypothetical protein n=1 Tax=unclassified Anaeromyxobacter TaxID=2620896 RepID=UPI001F5665C9|nr:MULTISPECIES: hypothetical protein [unclassified Anaeromyxobacter]
MTVRRALVASLAVAAALAWARPADASVALGLGADYLLDPEIGEFQLTLGVATPLARHLSVGARFGAMLLSEPSRVGVPLDVKLRVRMDRLYVEGLAGPWIVFDDDDALKLHAAVGFGLVARAVSFGLEVGYLDPTAMIGVRLAFPL